MIAVHQPVDRWNLPLAFTPLLRARSSQRARLAARAHRRDHGAERRRGRQTVEFLHRLEQIFDASDLEAAASVFTDDAVIYGTRTHSDTIGNAAIRELYAAAMAQVKLGARFNTEEIRVLSDLAYERGTYILTVSDKATGQVLSTAVNRHIHVLQRQPGGGWKTWRMMTNSPTPAPATP